MARFFVFFVIFLSACTNIVAPESTPTEAPLSVGKILYVSVDGNDMNPGTLIKPLQHIQACLDRILPGDTCEIMAGTYYESIVLRTTGTEEARITLKNHPGHETTINSGDEKSLVTEGRIDFYTIDGLRFVATNISAEQGDYTMDFSHDVWDGEINKDGGNNGFILRNTYVEGAVRFYGHNNLVENCELNGKNTWVNGLADHFAASHDNIYRNNIIHDYKVRGIWTMQNTDNILIEANQIYSIGGMGIDCDGAWIPVNRCNIIGNTIYDIGEGDGVLLENAFDSLVEGNTIFHVAIGISTINYGINNADPTVYKSSAEFRTTNTNMLIRNNLIYASNDGIICKASPGGKAFNNTIYNTTQANGYWAAIGLAAYGGYYCHGWEIKNNILSQTQQNALWYESSADGLLGLSVDYNLYDFDPGDRKFLWVVRDPVGDVWNRYTLAELQHLKQLDLHAIISDPLFIDPFSDDFHLKPTSPAIDGGEYLGVLNPRDFDGIIRPQGMGYDIGAYEYLP